jgi:hypothetical protein
MSATTWALGQEGVELRPPRPFNELYDSIERHTVNNQLHDAREHPPPEIKPGLLSVEFYLVLNWIITLCSLHISLREIHSVGSQAFIPSALARARNSVNTPRLSGAPRTSPSLGKAQYLYVSSKWTHYMGRNCFMGSSATL